MPVPPSPTSRALTIIRMSQDTVLAAPFELSGFIVDPASGTLTRDGEETQLQPKVMQLLVCLAEHHGQIVSKEFLLENVWRGTFVVDGALRRCIFLLRKALKHPERDESVLETLPRRGYRLIAAPAPITPNAESQADTTDSTPTEMLFEGEAYRGLQVFERSHADRFFGRQAAIEQVVNAFDAQAESGHGFCLILGPSGSGKSSLAMAGVVPALLGRDARQDLVCATFKLSDSPADPLERFATCLVEVIEDQHAAVDHASLIADQLRSDDEDAAVSAILELLGAQQEDSKKRLLLVFDQFEELLSDDTDPALRERFLSVLYPLVRSGNVWLLATMRSEFYPQFVAIEALRFMRGEHGQVDLNFPGAAEITDIVRKPAQLAGLTFDQDEKSRRLDQIIIDDATAQANSLPLLQFVLRELELKSADRVLRVADYHAMGTMEGCLSEHADRVFDALSRQAQDALPMVLERMVSADPRNAGRVLKRTVALGEFDELPGARELIDAFIDARLITTFIDKVNGAPAAQFAHEAVLANWGRGRDWVQANYAEIRFRTWINDLATRWHDDHRAKQYLLNDGKSLIEARRLVAGQVGLAPATADFVAASHQRASIRDVIRGAVTLSLAALTLLALFMWRSAENSREVAEASSRRAEATSDLVLSVFDYADPGISKDRELSALGVLDRARERMATQLSDAEPVDQASMLSKLGETYHLMGEIETASELLQNAETLLPSIEATHPDVAASVLIELSSIRKAQQALDESESYIERALTLARRAKDPLLTAHSLNIKGLLAQTNGDHAAAVELFQAAGNSLDNAVSSPAVVRLTPSVIANLGSSRMSLGDYPAADEAFVQAIALRREYGLDDTAYQSDLLSNRGTLAHLQQDHQSAVEYFSQAIELRSRLHGESHPRNAAYYVNRASAQMKLENFRAASDSARRGLEVVAQSTGHGDNVVALLHANRAMASWLADLPFDEAMMASAAKQVPVLARLYGQDAGITKALQATLAGLRLQQQWLVGSTDIAALCDRLAVAADNLPRKEVGESPLRAKAASQLAGCDALGNTPSLQ